MNSAGYGGSAQRGYEAPACVQNAMVTKDKKPFTYTPGGIDLSQIKSERMAKRLARNAQAEGATGASQHNRPAQPQSPGSGNVASQIGAAGMGMPFQVLPPPPPQSPGDKKPATATQQPGLNYSNNSTQPQQQHQYPPTQSAYSPSHESVQQQPQHNDNNSNNASPSPQGQQQSPRPAELRNVAPPQSPAINVYTRQTDSPRADAGTPPQQRATESPFRYGSVQQQQQQPLQQQRAAPAVSPLSQQQQPPKLYSSPPAVGAAAPTAANNSPNSQPSAQTVPWRTQRSPAQQQQQPQSTAIYNNVSSLPLQQQQKQQQQQPSSGYQGPKPTNVGSLYIAPLAPSTEPQAPNVVRQFQQQQQQQPSRESPIRQMPQQQQQTVQQGQPLRSTVPWLSSKPKTNEQPEWARPEENGNVVPSSLHRMKSPPPPAAQLSQQPQQQQQQPTYYPQQQQPQPQYYGYRPEQGNGYAATAPANFGSHSVGNSGLRLQINANVNANSSPTAQGTTGPRERIIPIQLEQTPTNTSQQPNFNVSYGGVTTAPSSFVVRSPNQFVDQGYNNYPASAGAQQPLSAQRVMSPTQQLNAPRIVQQQQQFTNNNNNNVGAGANRSRIIPISMEGEGARGPISSSPIVLQNDPRSSPIQSKSFRILQKITDTIDGGSSGGDDRKVQESPADVEPQLQRPQYARQMSAQQARQQPNVEQMRRMQIDPQHQQQQQQQSQSPHAWNQVLDMPQPYVHPSEQQVPEPKKYTGSAIPSRSFKILQAMTTPENAGPGQSDL